MRCDSRRGTVAGAAKFEPLLLSDVPFIDVLAERVAIQGRDHRDGLEGARSAPHGRAGVSHRGSQPKPGGRWRNGAALTSLIMDRVLAWEQFGVTDSAAHNAPVGGCPKEHSRTAMRSDDGQRTVANRLATPPGR